MDCQVKFADEENIVEMPLRFEQLPRLGERITLNSDGQIYTGKVYGVEHTFSKEGPHSVVIYVEAE